MTAFRFFNHYYIDTGILALIGLAIVAVLFWMNLPRGRRGRR